MLTYGDIYKQFLESTNIDLALVEDYRPCCELFGVPNIADAIIVWLKDKSKLIYIYK